jgi:hypothetical protein
LLLKYELWAKKGQARGLSELTIVTANLNRPKADGIA